jgi:tetratricopeptide (TPR) repeat protein
MQAARIEWHPEALVAIDWGWDEFDKQVELKAAEIKMGLGSSLHDETHKEAITNDLLDAGVAASQEGDEVEAVASFRVAVTVDPRCRKAYYNLGWEYLTMGNRLDQSLKRRYTLSASSLVSETPSKAPDERLTFYRHALRSLKRVLQLDIQDSRGWCLLGQTQYYLSDLEEAQVSLRKAVELDPDGEGGKVAREALEVVERSLRAREEEPPAAESQDG